MTDHSDRLSLSLFINADLHMRYINTQLAYKFYYYIMHFHINQPVYNKLMRPQFMFLWTSAICLDCILNYCTSEKVYLIFIIYLVLHT